MLETQLLPSWSCLLSYKDVSLSNPVKLHRACICCSKTCQGSLCTVSVSGHAVCAEMGLSLCTSGNVAPRRVVCVGFCIGGSIATLTAPWVAVQWPTADVRCISFGSSAVGNAAFTTAFKYVSCYFALLLIMESCHCPAACPILAQCSDEHATWAYSVGERDALPHTDAFGGGTGCTAVYGSF